MTEKTVTWTDSRNHPGEKLKETRRHCFVVSDPSSICHLYATRNKTSDVQVLTP